MSTLAEPLSFAGLDLSNRLVMPPMATSRATEDGSVTPRIVDYYDEKTRGGHIGLVIVEHSFVSPEGKANRGQTSISRDEDIAGLAEVAAAAHRNGSKIMAQISHAGGASTKAKTGLEPIGPSAVEMPWSQEVPREMDENDITRIIECFAAAAERAQRAGFDGVEIHSAHGYLLNQFYSPLTNKRTDAYGASTIAQRLTLHLAIVRAVRERVGSDYPIALRLGACDYREGGSTIEDGVEAAKLLEAADIDLLDITGGIGGYTHPDTKQPGYFADASTPIKRAVQIPVILTGGITERIQADELLAAGAANLIGVGRAILCDSTWAARAMGQQVS